MLGEWAEGTEWQEQYLIGQGREKVDIIQSDKKTGTFETPNKN